MNEKKEIRNIPRLLALHLLPGLAVVAGYAVLARMEALQGYPRTFVLGVAAILFLVPVELGVLLFLAKKETGRYDLRPILGLSNKLKAWEYAVYAVLLFVLAGLGITLMKPVTQFFAGGMFGWVPEWFRLTEDMSRFGKNILVGTMGIEFVALEELYFRGFLMSRMKWMGYYGVVLNTLLFAVYHFWSPWQIGARFVGMLPLFLVVYRKDSLKLSILVHCLCNFTDVVALLALLKP